MDNPTHPTQTKPTPGDKVKPNNPLKYAFDGRHFLPTTPPDGETPNPTESLSTHSNNSTTGQTSEPEYPDLTRATSLAASLRLIANTMLRMELAELEMMKRREIARLEAEERRAEVEDEMTMMMLQTHTHIASFVSQNSSGRKRKVSASGNSSSTSGTKSK